MAWLKIMAGEVSQFMSVMTADRFEGPYTFARKIYKPQWYVKPLAKQVIAGMERHFQNYEPDTSTQRIVPLPGIELKHAENTSISRHVWLPIEWDGDKPVLRWRDEWEWEKL